MREITMPEVKLPDIKILEGLRDMNRDDIVKAARDVRLPSKIELPDIDLSKVDLSKVELPKALADRLPRRRRLNPLLPIAGIAAIGALIAAAWWLFTSPLTGPRARSVVSDLKQRVTGERNDVVRYDNEENLTSLLATDGEGHSAMDSEPFSSTADMSDLGNGVPAGQTA